MLYSVFDSDWYNVLHCDVDVFFSGNWINNMCWEFVFVDCANSFYNCCLGIVTPSIVRKGVLLLEVIQIVGFLHFRLSYKIVKFLFNLYLSRWRSGLKFLGCRWLLFLHGNWMISFSFVFVSSSDILLCFVVMGKVTFVFSCYWWCRA